MVHTLLLLTMLPATLHADTTKPNVLFIAVDDLRDWVGYLGHDQARTPNLDRLAKRGVYFTRSFCAAPSCNPSRAALLSGIRPSSSGVYVNSQDWRKPLADTRTLQQHFQNNGYATFGCGKIYHGAFTTDKGWTDYFRPKAGKGKKAAKEKDGGVGGIKFSPLSTGDEQMPDYRFVTYALGQLKKKHEKPFFLAVGFTKPHMPWSVPKKYFDMHPLDKIKLPPHKPDDLEGVPPAGVKMARPNGDHAAIVKSGRWKEAVQGYLAAISFFDAQLGRLIDGFDKSDYKDNTIIVLWSDHGWHLGEKKHWRKFALWEQATRSPLLFVGPGIKPGVCHRTVDLMCVYPTLCDLCGLSTPKHVQGKSVKPLLDDPKAKWGTPALMTWMRNNHAVRTERWRYIRYANGDEELYDHDADPNEWKNLAAEAKYADVKKQLARFFPKENKPDVK
jgi:arylsulfatase A-like enzyme